MVRISQRTDTPGVADEEDDPSSPTLKAYVEDSTLEDADEDAACGRRMADEQPKKVNKVGNKIPMEKSYRFLADDETFYPYQ